MKHSLKILGIIILVSLTVVIVTTYILATSRIGENYIRRQAETRIRRALGTPVLIGSLETNLLSRLVLDDVRVYSDSIVSEPSIILARGEVRFRLFDLLRKRLTLSGILLDSLMVDVARDSTGIQGIPGLSRDGSEKVENTGSGGFPLEISLGRLELNDSEAHYSDRVFSLDADVRNLDAAITGGDGGYNLELGAGSGSVEFRGNPLDIGSLSLRGSWREGVLRLPEIQLDVAGLTISAETTLDTSASPPALEGSMNVYGNPTPVAAVFEEYIPERALPRSGNLRLDATFSGLLDSTRTVTVVLAIDSLSTTDASLRNAAIRGEYSHGRLVIEQLQGMMFGGEVEGSGEIALTGDFQHDVALTVSGIELNDILRAATGSEQPYSGTINGCIASQGPVDLQQLQADADLTIENLALGDQSIDTLEAILSFQLGVLDVDMHQGETSIQAQASINDRDLSGELEAEIDRLQPIVLLFGVTGLDATGKVSGSLSGTLDQPEFEVSVDARDGEYRGLPVESLTGRLTYHNGEFRIAESEFNGEAVSVDSLVSAWNLPGAIHGGIGYSGNFSGWADDPHLELSAALTAPAWNDIVFDSGDVELTLRCPDTHP